MKLFFRVAFSFFLFLLPGILLTQDSLHLVGTITGDSDARITDVKGVGDVNGDGYDDFMVTNRLYLGSPNFNFIPSVTFHYPGNDTMIGGFGWGTGIGDVNGDGYNDFTIKGIFYDWDDEKGKVFLYFGGSNIDTLPKYEFYEPGYRDYFGYDVEGVGDINKDGYDDFIITSLYNWSTAKGRAYLFYGGDTIAFSRSITFVDTMAIGKPMDSFFGRSASNIGDINKDGYNDIAISSGLSIEQDKVYLYHGGANMDTIPESFIIIDDIGFGRTIRNMGDINKDETIDYCIASVYRIYVYLDGDSLIVINDPAATRGGGIQVESNCDINRDGYNDFVFGSTDYKNSEKVMVGGAFVYLGGEIMDTVYKYKYEGEHKWDYFSQFMTAADINGDGYDELLILAPNYPDYNNPLGKIYIYSYKNLNQVDVGRETIPDKFILHQNYPNPFNSSTVISYKLTVRSEVGLRIFDILGREIATLVDGIQQTGGHTINFDASGLSSGVYFYRLKSGNYVSQKSMLLLK